MADTRANRFGGGAGCWAGHASIPTANWWRRGGARRVCGQCWAGLASNPTANWWRRGETRRVRGQGGGHTLDHDLDILPLRFAPSFSSNFEFLAQTCNPRSKLGREERKV